MQSEFSFIEKATAVANYKPQAINRKGDKLWFSYINKMGRAINAYYDFQSRSFKSVVKGSQYGKDEVAIRNLVARPVVEGILGNG
tara:strand:- start:261 stop:515 length:255 start_codon:yes stop_codon:yes gene_type:complete